jgi:integrase
VFTTLKRGKDRKVGTVVHPGNVLRVLYDVLDAAKLPRTRFHDLRHSAASLPVAEGVQLAAVSMLLGHSELRITADCIRTGQNRYRRRPRATWTQFLDGENRHGE